MKNTVGFLATLVLVFFATALSAQKTVYWLGGAPGQTTAWDCPKNWSNHAVPNGFSDVVVPDVSTRSGSYPVISERGFEVNSLRLEAGAALTVGKKGSLTVSQRLDCLDFKQLKNHGSFKVLGEDASCDSTLNGRKFTQSKH